MKIRFFFFGSNSFPLNIKTFVDLFEERKTIDIYNKKKCQFIFYPLKIIATRR